MFSPYYAWARRRAAGGAAEPADHCAVNVALYRCGPGPRRGSAWAMTERGHGALRRDARHLQIGPSALQWDGDTLTVTLDERAAPWPSRLRGTVRLHAPQRNGQSFLLASNGNHRWQPIAPSARIEVDLPQPGVRWSGRGYFDTNRGDAPLEQAFTRWDWSRAHLPGGGSVVLYDVERVHDAPQGIALQFDAANAARPLAAPPPLAGLPLTRWRVARGTRCDGGAQPQVVQTLTDAPFYARSVVRTTLDGMPVTAMHESLSLRRFDSAWVQAMLPFRMPRRAAWPAGSA